ncbi:MAG: hypothetical protein FWH11_14715 [Micrococcales bacterium]|nr:hypothetical protein [Micrococcales bacterium]
MKKLVAVFGAIVLSLGLVTACDQSGDSGASRGPGGLIGDAGGSDPGSDDGVIDVEQWVSDYVTAAAQVRTVHIVVTQDVSGGGGNQATTRMEIDMDVKARAYAVAGEIMGVSFEMVIIGDTVYFDLDGTTQEMSLDALGMSEDEMNPAADIERQRDAITKVELVGSEKVGGVPTDHYVITYDVAKMNEILDAQSMDGVIQGGTVTADVWLDDKMQTMRYKSTIKVEAAGITGKVTSDAVYSDYGKPVTIKAPR